MRGSGSFWRALEQARRANLAAAGAAAPVAGSSGITRRALIRALGAGAAIAALPRSEPAYAGKGVRVAIVGGGIAGLSALHHLRAAGIDARIYEARERLGGRMHTRRLPGGVTFERGAQLVNSDHADIRALAAGHGVALVDRKQAPHRTLVLADGAIVEPARLAQALGPIAARIDADAAALDKDYARVAPRFDRLSMAAYLDRHAALIREPWVRRLLEGTARTEYGVEPERASALELLFNLPVVDGERVEVLGGSDERYVIDGGSSALVDAIASRHTDRIETGRELLRIEAAGSGVRLIFRKHAAVEADRVIVAVPGSRASYIEYGLPLPAEWRAFIAAMELGRNEKLQIAMRDRPWLDTLGAGGEAWFTDADSPCALAWDGGVHSQAGHSNVWTWFMGGAQAANPGATPMATELYRPTAPIMANIGAHRMTDGQQAMFDRTGWGVDPHSRGAYVNFPPGQLTRFGHLLWLEADSPAERQVAGAGRILFAGEHLSDAFPGYMNGAAQTGRLAAEAVTGTRILARAA